MIPPVLDDVIRRLMEKDQASVFALADVAAERLRQIEVEGWTPDHDETHPHGQLAAAGAAYALARHTSRGKATAMPGFWPWSSIWWKPGSKHRNYTRAGALIVAELAKQFRLAPFPTPEE